MRRATDTRAVGRAPAADGGQGTAAPGVVRVLLIAEYTLGHVTFVDALAQRADERGDIELTVLRLPFDGHSRWARTPLVGSWSARASWAAWWRSRHLWLHADVVLVHTQTASLLLRHRMRTTPTWVSLDATPLNMDAVGSAYAHRVGHPLAERVKRALVRSPLQGAAGAVGWSHWVEQSLVQDYGVPVEKVRTISPGVLLPGGLTRSAAAPVRLLMVAGDFVRKGGLQLLDAFQQLEGDVELDVVTGSLLDVVPERVRVHHGLTPTSPELATLYREAHVAVLPTLGDASPFAVVEAMGWGLPVVTTPVGAIPEAVVHGVTGFLVEPGGVAPLVTALQLLVDDPARRLEMGEQGRRRAEEHYDRRVNTDALLDLLRETGLEGLAAR